MRIALPTVRARLTLWHAGALTLVICLFAVGVFLFVRASLYRSLDQQVREDLATIEKVYREETGDLGELALRTGMHFEVTEGPAVVFRTAGWDIINKTDKFFPPGYSIHEVGTCRMGNDPKTSVLNRWCQAWDCKNLFITDAAPFVSNADKNPTLSITALGWRTSDYIADQIKKRNL